MEPGLPSHFHIYFPEQFVPAGYRCNRQTYSTTLNYTRGMLWHTKTIAKLYPCIIWQRILYAKPYRGRIIFHLYFGCYTGQTGSTTDKWSSKELENKAEPKYVSCSYRNTWLRLFGVHLYFPTLTTKFTICSGRLFIVTILVWSSVYIPHYVSLDLGIITVFCFVFFCFKGV